VVVIRRWAMCKVEMGPWFWAWGDGFEIGV
jgi:hypothetical protein